MNDFDVVVIGGGTAGTAAAREAAGLGARTAMIRDEEIGGTCILRGCMPTKAILESAHVAHVARTASSMGVETGPVRLDFGAVRERQDRLVRRFQRAKEGAVEAEDHEVLVGAASLVGPTSVRCEAADGSERTIRAGRIVVAVGSEPRTPPIDGLADVQAMTSDEALRLDEPPRSLLVVGAGAIGLEMAQFFARAGTDVTLVSLDPLLASLDAPCGVELASALRAEGIDVLERAVAQRARKDGADVVLEIERDGERIERRARRLLVATGRRARLDGLGLERAGVEVEGGRVRHDEHMRTSAESVFVAGDATGTSMILHEAAAEGAVAGWNAAGGSPQREVERRLPLRVVFTDPPFALVGPGAAERDRLASEDGRSFACGRVRLAETGRAITMGVEHGSWALWADRSDCSLVASAILAPRADDLVHLVMLMIDQRMTAHALHRLPFYHPTLAEVLINVGRDLAEQLGDCEKPRLPPA